MDPISPPDPLNPPAPQDPLAPFPWPKKEGKR